MLLDNNKSNRNGVRYRERATVVGRFYVRDTELDTGTAFDIGGLRSENLPTKKWISITGLL